MQPRTALGLGLGLGVLVNTVGAQTSAIAEPRLGMAHTCPSGTVVKLQEPPANPPPAAAPTAQPGDYRHRLSPTPLGWPTRPHWCVWIEPAASEGPAARWDQAWLEAVEAALASWGELVPLTRVSIPEQAQVRILRRRPPLQGGRASHGRAELALVVMQRDGTPQLEPQVVLSLGPGQRPAALQATALHELGHAFGLWGHSDSSSDAMAAVPGPVPVLQLSERDRATFRWLQQQPGLKPGAPPAGP